MLAVPSSRFRNRLTTRREARVTRTAAPKMMRILTHGSANKSLVAAMESMGPHAIGRPASRQRRFAPIDVRAGSAPAVAGFHRLEDAGRRVQHEPFPHLGELVLGHRRDRRCDLAAVLAERVRRLAM